jgi:hypothetical protein
MSLMVNNSWPIESLSIIRLMSITESTTMHNKEKMFNGSKKNGFRFDDNIAFPLLFVFYI